MGNEFEYLSDRGDHGGHCSYSTASNKHDYLKTRFFDLQMLIT